jgi:serine/threonine protein kinase
LNSSDVLSFDDLEDPYLSSSEVSETKSEFEFIVPDEISNYINQQAAYGFTYQWNPNIYYGLRTDDTLIGFFEPSYRGPLSYSERMQMIQQHPDRGQSIFVHKTELDYVFDRKQLHQASVYLQDRYELLEELGRGSFGVTYHGRDLTTGQSVAIKMIQLDKLKQRGYTKSFIDNEIDALAKLSANGGSEYMVMYYGSFETMHHGHMTLCIISEYIEGQTLTNFLRTIYMTERSIRPTILWPLYLQLILGLNFIHQHGYVHRDIKPDNIMITSDYRIKYIDFGLACFEQCQLDACNNNCGGAYGTIAYIPPELLKEKSKTLAFSKYQNHDIWSLGLTLYQMANANRLPSFYPLISNYKEDQDNRTNIFLQTIIVVDPNIRPNINTVLQIFVQSILKRVWIPK